MVLGYPGMKLKGISRKVMGGSAKIFGSFIRYGIGRIIPDKIYISLDYKRVFGERPDFKNPVTYSEKLQWLKLYDRNPIYRTLADKLEARKYISENYGSEYLFPLIGVFSNYDDIDFGVLPDEFVLKPNHTSGDIFICRDKSSINHVHLKKIIGEWMKRDYYYAHREWQYKGLERKILCEKLMEDEVTGIPWNYKFFCFNGEPRILLLTTGQGSGRPQNYFNMNLEPISVWNSMRDIHHLEKPEGFDEMLNLVHRLVKSFIHVRMDMYIISGRIYIGEFTFHHLSGVKKWEPEKFDRELGSMLKLPQSMKKAAGIV
jgi:hypothetical protein